MTRLPLAALILVLSPAAARAADQFTVRYERDSFFDSYPSVTWSRSSGTALGYWGMFVDYPSSQSSELDLGLTRGIFSYGLGATFGPASWGLSPVKRSYALRDAVPDVDIVYSSPTLEWEVYEAAWIPTQESWRTAVWYVESEAWAAPKLAESQVGLGPQVELFWTKEGGKAMTLSQAWTGGIFIKDWNQLAFHMFLGYDWRRLSDYFGQRKERGAVFRISCAHSF